MSNNVNRVVERALGKEILNRMVAYVEKSEGKIKREEAERVEVNRNCRN